MNFILIAVIVLGAIALIAALVLYVCSKRFAVYEDPRIAQVNELLPGANCGGCGFAGCGGMADALVKGADAGSIEGLNCPVGGSEVMGRVADLLGMAHYDVDSDFGSHTIMQTNRMDTQKVKVSVRYNFNAAPSKYRGTGAGADEKARM